ncbi:MAG: hypothetical protein ACTSWQ_06235 [Candidatus Thorarchaeota archaeon]
MSDIVLNVSIPLDDDRFLRRECPQCMQEFKVQMSPEDLRNLAEQGIESFLTDDESDKTDDTEEITEFFCPYCGQVAPTTHWWTQEQLSYMQVYAKNIMAKIVNEQLIKPMKRSFAKSSGPISISFKSSEMEYEEPWISDEVNDMRVFDLPCCNEKLKVIEDWRKNVVCYYCGFKHEVV